MKRILFFAIFLGITLCGKTGADVVTPPCYLKECRYPMRVSEAGFILDERLRSGAPPLTIYGTDGRVITTLTDGDLTTGVTLKTGDVLRISITPQGSLPATVNFVHFVNGCPGKQDYAKVVSIRSESHTHTGTETHSKVFNILIATRNDYWLMHEAPATEFTRGSLFFLEVEDTFGSSACVAEILLK